MTKLEIRAVVGKEDAEKRAIKKDRPRPKPKFTKEDIYYQAIAVINGRYLPSQERFGSGSFLSSEGVTTASLEPPLKYWMGRNEGVLEKDCLYQAWVRTVKTKDLNGNVSEFLFYRLLRVIPEYPDWIAPIPQGKIKGNRVKVRGQTIFSKDKKVVVKVQQNKDAKKRFQVVLNGNLPEFRPGQFWELFAVQQDNELILDSGKLIAPPQKKKVFKGKK